MWAQYSAARPDVVRSSPEYTIDRFGDSVELSDALLGLVVHGSKRATADLVDEFAARGEELPRLGSHWIACDGSGVPRVVLRSVELRVGTISSADEAFARDEGEDDRTLASWLTEHRRYWTRTCAARGATFTDTDEIVFERFRVVWPPELAD
ncbi:ASCH domain-containing protein [Georgenia subflava]|uniref:ASCH domain-containing protein n=1 Tax=Georgenia subflava TaxID=1622177 RepID=UPI00126498EF|nr:ASCH domain-containing protein [Georgenia subflava]